MSQTQRCSMATSGFLADYECHLADFCGFAFNSRRLHLRVVRNFLDIRFAATDSTNSTGATTSTGASEQNQTEVGRVQ